MLVDPPPSGLVTPIMLVAMAGFDPMSRIARSYLPVTEHLLLRLHPGTQSDISAVKFKQHDAELAPILKLPLNAALYCPISAPERVGSSDPIFNGILRGVRGMNLRTRLAVLYEAGPSSFSSFGLAQRDSARVRGFREWLHCLLRHL